MFFVYSAAKFKDRGCCIMEDVVSVPELAAKILSGSIAQNACLIAKLRMVCRRGRDLFAVSARKSIKQKYVSDTTLVTTTAGMYAVWNYNGRGPYCITPPELDYLDRAGVGGWGCSARYNARVIHLANMDGGHTETGFDIDPEDFIALNRLFGLKSRAYDVLLYKPDAGGDESAAVICAGCGVITVVIDGDEHVMHVLTAGPTSLVCSTCFTAVCTDIRKTLAHLVI